MPHDHDPDLTPAEEVRRLLADARHTEPMPADVAARLDGVLAGLAADDGAGPPRASDGSAARAADLAAARRRRTVRNLLVAAAAVVAIGVGINEADLTVSGGAEDAMSSDTSGGGDAAPGAAPGAESQREGAADAVPNTSSADKPRRAELDSGLAGYAVRPVRLSAERFGTQVRRLRVETKELALNDMSGQAATDGLFSLDRALRPGCSTRGWGAGLLVPVRYDGGLGALVFRRALGETQVVDLFLCGSDEPARSITLPTP